MQIKRFSKKRKTTLFHSIKADAQREYVFSIESSLTYFLSYRGKYVF